VALTKALSSAELLKILEQKIIIQLLQQALQVGLTQRYPASLAT